jgi:hypothetical protein
VGVTLKQLELLAQRHDAAVQRLEACRTARNEAIVELLSAGHTSDVVAAHARLTQPRVVQISRAAQGAPRRQR